MKTLAKSSFRNVLEAHAQPPDGIAFYASLEEIGFDHTLTAYAHLLGNSQEIIYPTPDSISTSHLGSVFER
ncbi:MAG: hypothetical protein GY846_12485 [Deltaproteobacteria bacterium]|nr:hypothetical protein [Deltaproteobacteria bacterium]